MSMIHTHSKAASAALVANIENQKTVVALNSIYQRVIRVLTGSYSMQIKAAPPIPRPPMAYTDKAHIYINGPLLATILGSDRLTALHTYRGLVYHEFGHVLFTPFGSELSMVHEEVRKEMCRKMGLAPSQTTDSNLNLVAGGSAIETSKNIIMTLEESRMERMLVALYPRVEKSLLQLFLSECKGGYWPIVTAMSPASDIDANAMNGYMLVRFRNYLPAKMRQVAANAVSGWKFTNKSGYKGLPTDIATLERQMWRAVNADSMASPSYVDAIANIALALSQWTKNEHFGNAAMKMDLMDALETAPGHHSPASGTGMTGSSSMSLDDARSKGYGAGDESEDESESGSASDGSDDGEEAADGSGGSNGSGESDGEDGDGDESDAKGKSKSKSKSKKAGNGAGGEDDGLMVTAIMSALKEHEAGLLDDIDSVGAELDQLASTLGKGVVLPSNGKHRFSPVDAEQFAVGNLRQSKYRIAPLAESVEAYWEPQQRRGRLNPKHVIQTRGHSINVFDEWKEDMEDATSFEVVIGVDVSGSMQDDLGRLAQDVWTVKSLCDAYDAPCTVMSYGSTFDYVYEPGERAGSKVKYIDSAGGTKGAGVVNNGYAILRNSKKRHRLFLVLTDGEWEDFTDHTVDMINDMTADGVHTCIVLYMDGSYAQSWKNSISRPGRPRNGGFGSVLNTKSMETMVEVVTLFVKEAMSKAAVR